MDFTKDEIAKALKIEDHQIQDITIKPLKTNIPGFSSEILEMIVTVTPQEKKHFIIKKKPMAESLAVIIQESDLFSREVNFFNKALPELERRINNLPIVKCYIAKSNAILLEHLTLQGYKVIAKSMSDIARNVINLHQVKLAISNLAKFHSSSVDIQWLDILPELNSDIMMDCDSNPFKNWLSKASLGYSKLLEYIYPMIDDKYSQWLQNVELVKNTYYKFIKPSNKYQNVLGHADFWVNNIMYHFNEDNIADDVKIIDFQCCRYVPASRDIHNLIYTCLDKKFRDSNEQEIIECYVNSFNQPNCQTLTTEEFTKEYNDGKLFGILQAFVFRSLNLMPEMYPKQGEIMTNEMFQNMISGKQFETLIYRYETDSYFNTAAHDLLDEFIEIFDNLHL